MIPPYGDNALNGHAWVPIDDENCTSWCLPTIPRPLSEHELHTMRTGGIHVKLIPGSFRLVVNKDNDYMIDRAAQASKAIAASPVSRCRTRRSRKAGPIQTVAVNLVSTDNGVIWRASGCARPRSPPRRARTGRHRSGHPRRRSASIVLPEDVGFYGRGRCARGERGVTHTSV
jgi:hypothetical protein